MFARRESLRELVRRQHQEFMSYQERRNAEFREYAEEGRAAREEGRAAREESRVAIEESRAALEESRAALEETIAAREEGKDAIAEFREFNREILLRNEKVYTSVIAEMEEGRKQIAANTEAVLSVLDRMNGSGPPA
jgi:hypothetical protein